MGDDALRVEFKVALGNRKPTQKAAPGAKRERQRQDRAARKARNLALAYWIDALVRSGEYEDLAAVAAKCGVSRSQVSKIVGLLAVGVTEQERVLALR